MEGGRKSQAVEHNGRYNAPGERANTRLVDDGDPCDRARENVRGREEYQEEYEHHAGELVAESAPHEAHSVGVVLDPPVPQLDLADRIAGVDGNYPEANGDDDPGYHAQHSEGARDAE